MEELLKIAQQNLDDYSIEIKSCMVLHDLSRSDLQQALERLAKVGRQMDDILVQMTEADADKFVFGF